MDDGQGEQFALTMQELCALLLRLHQLEADQGSAVLARLKHMQRLSLLAELQVGRGRSVVFPLEAVLKIALVFEFLAAGVPSYRAVETVRDRWPDCRSALVSKTGREGAGGAQMLVFLHSALRGVGQVGTAAKKKTSGELISVAASKVGSLLRAGTRRQAVVVQPELIVRDLRVAAQNAGLPIAAFDKNLLSLASSVSGEP